MSQVNSLNAGSGSQASAGRPIRRFRLVERELRLSSWGIRVEGELDLAVAEELRAMLDGVDDRYRRILIDLHPCEFIDSTGIAVVVNAHRRLAEQGRRVAVYAPTSQVLRVLSLTGLTSNSLVFESLEEALAEVEPGAAVEQS